MLNITWPHTLPPSALHATAGARSRHLAPALAWRDTAPGMLEFSGTCCHGRLADVAAQLSGAVDTDDTI